MNRSSSNQKKQRRNPFSAPIKLQASQPQLPFFTKPLSKSSSNLGEKKPEEPLGAKSSSSLNRSSSTPNFFNPGPKSKSSLCQMKSGSFDDSFDDDDGYLNEKPINLKHSKPVGSFLPQNSRNNIEVSTKNILTPPTSTESHHKQSFTQPAQLSRQSSSASSSSGTQPKFKLGSLKSPSSQSTLNFGGSQPTKRKLSPWDNNVISTKTIKNPRLKETKPSSASSSNYSSASTKIKLSDEQLKVLDLVVKDNKNVFYTGSAGTGKSVLLKELVSRLKLKYLRDGPSAVAVTASTGLAAVNIGGITINKFSGMGIAAEPPQRLAARVSKNKQASERWKRTRVLIIDEISMIDGSFLDKLEYVARSVRKIAKPFGGIQVVLTGDFFQLPPVPNRNGPAPLFSFQANCWSESIHKTILLKQVFRQKDNSFVEMLNCLRLGEITDSMARSFRELSREVYYEDGIEPTELFCTRNEVDQANSKRLRQLPGQLQIFDADDIAGTDSEKKSLENVMAVKQLVLKEDAQVMMLKNKDETLVNGTAGKVITFFTAGLFLKFKVQYRDYELDSEETIKQLRLISMCISETQIPAKVLEYAQTAQNPTFFMELATLALRESTTHLAPLVKFSTILGPRVELIEKDDFFPDSQSETGCKRSQFPLLLSWALSIHKSQGQTIERVKVDLTRVFEIGQVYVALSRAVSKDKLQIVNFREDKIRSSPIVKRFYSQLESL